LGQPEKVAWITTPRAKAHLPSILGRPEIQRLLNGFTTAKYCMFFTLIYATGLRINEASLLETRDIDSMQKVIHVRNGKGGKERMVPMDGKLYGLLRTYYKHEQPPKPWLFASKSGNPICPETARRALPRPQVQHECRPYSAHRPPPRLALLEQAGEPLPTPKPMPFARAPKRKLAGLVLPLPAVGVPVHAVNGHQN
jgi:site-specific recombinase XerD